MDKEAQVDLSKVIADLQSLLSRLEQENAKAVGMISQHLNETGGTYGAGTASAIYTQQMGKDIIKTTRQVIEVATITSRQFAIIESSLRQEQEWIKLLLGLGKDTPPEEVWDRAKRLGDFYQSILDSAGGKA